MKNKVIVKDKNEWSSLANFIGNMIAKYADEIDFDSLSKKFSKDYVMLFMPHYFIENSIINTFC